MFYCVRQGRKVGIENGEWQALTACAIKLKTTTQSNYLDRLNRKLINSKLKRNMINTLEF